MIPEGRSIRRSAFSQILIYRYVRTNFYGKVLIDLFQKVAGVGSAHENAVSFC
jgi:hypothetical protein